MLTVEDLTRRWAAAWASTRGAEVGEVAGWPKVYVGSASRTTEIVCADPDRATWATLLEQVVGEPTAMLSVVSAHPGSYVADLPAGVRVDRDDETLMALRPGSAVASREVDVTAFAVDREEDDHRVVLRLVTDGRVAAEGTAGILGRDAVYDLVETTPAFRRRGLAGWVMTDLQRSMGARGASTGLLVATTDGAGLYRGLGWADIAPILSLRGTADGCV